MESDSNLKDVAFILHYRKDSEDRKRNLHLVVPYLAGLQPRELIVLQDELELDEDLKKLPITQLIHHPNPRNFQKAKCFNHGAQVATTPILFFWDVDVLVAPPYIHFAVDRLKDHQADHIYPFNGKFVDVKTPYIPAFLNGDKDIQSEPVTGNYVKTELSSERSPGGCNGITREAFEKINGYDERFVGWGFEDTDFYRRSSQVNIVKYLADPMAICWHLHHEKAIRETSPDYIHNLNLFNQNVTTI